MDVPGAVIHRFHQRQLSTARPLSSPSALRWLANSLAVGNNRGVNAVSDLQIWTMISSFSALMVGGFGMMMWLVRSEIGGLRAEMKSEIGGFRTEMKSEIGGLRTEMASEVGGLRAEMGSETGGLRAEMSARFDDVNHRLDAVQADMYLVKEHMFGKIPA